MRIAVMGAGGVGGYFGGRLVQAGHDVTFIARGRHLEALKANGLTLKSPLGDANLQVRAVGSAADAGPAEIALFAVKLWDTEESAAQLRPVVAKGGFVIPFQNGVESVARIGAILGKERVMGGAADAGPAEIALFAVKLWDTEESAAQLRPVVAKGGFVMPFQNGVESVARIGAILGKERVMGGAAYIAGRIGEPGVIMHTGTIARLRFGPVVPAQRSAAQAFYAACQGAKIDCELAEDIERVLWEKFVLLVAISATTAVSRRTIGVVRTDPDLRWLLETVMRETWAVGRKRGVALADDLVAKTLAQAEAFPPEMRASMAADLEAGGKLEAPWLSGAVARMAAEAGIEAPANRAVFAALKPYLNGR